MTFKPRKIIGGPSVWANFPEGNVMTKGHYIISRKGTKTLDGHFLGKATADSSKASKPSSIAVGEAMLCLL
jgi:hypothetical protein